MGITAELYESDNVTKVRDLNADFHREFQDLPSRAGSHTVSVDVDDAAQLADCSFGRLVRYSIDGYLAWTGRIEEPDITTIAEDEEIEEIALIAGRGYAAEWDDCRVYPPLGVDGLPTTQTRYFGFMDPNYDSNGWANAVSVRPVRDSQGRYHPPKNWPFHEGDHWIWSRGPALTQPLGSSYFVHWFLVADECTAVAAITADDGFDFWLDGSPIFIDTEPAPAETWRDTYSAGVRLTPGWHYIAIRAENYHRDFPDQFLNIAGVVCNVWKVDPSTGLPSILLTQTSGTGWKCVDYPAQAPGMTAGHILTILWNEERVRSGSPLADWTLDFDPWTDSAGNPWPTLPLVSFACGTTSLLQVLEKLSEAFIDWRVMPGQKRLQMWVKGTTTVASGVTLAPDTNVTSANFATKAPVANAVIGRWKRGWFETTNPTSISTWKRRTHDLVLGDCDDKPAAEAIAQQYVNLYGEPQVAATIGYLPADLAGMPYRGGWGTLATVAAFDQHGDPATYQVQGITCSDSADLLDENGDAAVEVVLELNTRLQGDIAKLTSSIDQMAAGSFGGRSLSASPAPDLDSGLPTGRVQDVHIDPSSQNGPAITDISGKWRPEQNVRLGTITVSVNVKDTTHPILVRALKNNVPIPLANGLTYLTLPADEFEAFEVFASGTFLTTLDRLKVEVFDAGSGNAEDLVVQVTASSIS